MGVNGDFRVGSLSVPVRVRNPPESTGSGASEPQSCMRAKKKRGFRGGVEALLCAHTGPPPSRSTAADPANTPTTRFSGLHPTPCKRATGGGGRGGTEDRGGVRMRLFQL